MACRLVLVRNKPRFAQTRSAEPQRPKRRLFGFSAVGVFSVCRSSSLCWALATRDRIDKQVYLLTEYLCIA